MEQIELDNDDDCNRIYTQTGGKEHSSLMWFDRIA